MTVFLIVLVLCLVIFVFSLCFDIYSIKTKEKRVEYIRIVRLILKTSKECDFKKMKSFEYSYGKILPPPSKDYFYTGYLLKIYKKNILIMKFVENEKELKPIMSKSIKIFALKNCEKEEIKNFLEF